MHESESVPWWRTRSGLVLLGFLAIGGYFLVTEHRAHLALAIPYLPWLLLLACPLMHLFMHHGSHGGHEGQGSGTPGPGDSPHQISTENLESPP